MLLAMGSHDVEAPWFLFAHGAGAPSTSDWMLHYKKLLEQFGPVESFNYAYMAEGRRRPDPMPKLLQTHQEKLTEGVKKHGKRVVLVGKSMGGRMGCHLALQEAVSGVICLGYPLKSMGKTGKLRDEVLLELKTPACFIQGTRDNLCPLDLLEDVLAKRKAASTLHVVPTGNHSLEPTKTHLKQTGLSVEDLEGDSMAAISGFLQTLED